MKSERHEISIGDIDTPGREVKCQGCKGVARRIDDKTAFTLRGDEDWLLPPAFECTRCQAIIFEEEFDGGRFVPPQFREESVPSITRALECPLK